MSEDVKSDAPKAIDDLKTGMELKGTVKRLELYGAFVDVGIGHDALLHISQLGKPNVRNVEDVLNVGDEVTVYVLKVDKDPQRVALSLEQPPALPWDQIKEGMTLNGEVVRMEDFGVFVDVGAERPGMVHVSELAEGYVKTPSDVVSIGDEVEVRVLKVNRRKRQIDLTMKATASAPETTPEPEDEEMPTAMALAFKRAMEEEEEDQSEEEETSRKSKKSRKRDEEQDDIISRTLRRHIASNN